MPHRRRTVTAVTATLLTLIVGVTACGDDAASSDPTTTAGPTTTTDPTTITDPVAAPTKAGLRGVRYCEVLLLRQEPDGFRAEVWNTLGMNDCPEADWRALDADAIATERTAAVALLNGPRYWTLDSITSDIRAGAAETTFGNLGMFLAATIDLGPALPAQTPYTERGINRETVFGFDAGTEVYRLVTPDGTAYVMQAYSQIVDPTLDAAALPGLGDRLALPEGWTYEVATLAEDLDLVSTDGVATVVQDELQNTYQRIDAAADTTQEGTAP